MTPQAVKECHLPTVAPNSLLIAITGQGKTLGNSAIARIETCIHQHLAYAQFHAANIVADFVLWFMQTRYDYLRAIAHGGGSTKGALTCGFLKTLPIPVPSRAEQEEIAANREEAGKRDGRVSAPAEAAGRRRLPGAFRGALLPGHGGDFDGIAVRFCKCDFDHCFFESSQRNRIKDAFSMLRAERLEWIAVTLQDVAAERFQGWDRDSKTFDKERRLSSPRYGASKGGQECPPSLFFDDLLDAKVREFNPRYAEAEGALPGQFRHLHTDIYGNRDFVEHLRNRGKFFDHEESRERDLILIHYEFYRVRAEGHNVPVLNPGKGPDQNPRAVAKIVTFESAAQQAVAVVDLSQAYQAAANRLIRTLTLEDRKRLVVTDEVGARQPAELWWFLHTEARVTLSHQNRTATLSRDGKSFTVQLQEPAGAAFEVMDCKPLPTSPNPQPQTSNAGRRKLAVHLRNVENSRVQVMMAP
ncbi:MAG: hypothetical protein FJ387_21075 [Verrucomicrobia bacterium]|nr:hypothetical protein [Verrucomicrobiota bacterium]